MQPLFECDESKLRQIDPSWKPEELLDQDGVFYLKDLARNLEFETNRVTRKVRTLTDAGIDPWQEIGLRKIWSHWMVRMKHFKPYYLKELSQKVRTVNPAWNGNDLLNQEGTFFLAEVCKKIPFSAHQLRYQCKRLADPRSEIGVYKDEYRKAYLVDMPVFSRWIAAIWFDGF